MNGLTTRVYLFVKTLWVRRVVLRTVGGRRCKLLDTETAQ